jgi:hypothetical protein
MSHLTQDVSVGHYQDLTQHPYDKKIAADLADIKYAIVVHCDKETFYFPTESDYLTCLRRGYSGVDGISTKPSSKY